MNLRYMLMSCLLLFTFVGKVSAQYFAAGVNIPMLATGTVNLSLETTAAPN